MWTLHSDDRKVPVGCSNSIRVSRKLAEEHSDKMTNSCACNHTALGATALSAARNVFTTTTEAMKIQAESL